MKDKIFYEFFKIFIDFYLNNNSVDYNKLNEK